MNTHVNFEIAKLLKEKGFSWECRHFYNKDKYDKEFFLRTGLEYDSDKELIWDWNLNGGKLGRLSKIIPYPNDSDAIYYSAPTIAEVIMWLYENHRVWIYADSYELGKWCYYHRYNRPSDLSPNITKGGRYSREDYNSPTEAYEAAILYALNNLI